MSKLEIKKYPAINSSETSKNGAFGLKTTIALCSKSNGRCDIKAEKREELESKSSHKSDIWPPAASKKWGEIY